MSGRVDALVPRLAQLPEDVLQIIQFLVDAPIRAATTIVAHLRGAQLRYRMTGRNVPATRDPEFREKAFDFPRRAALSYENSGLPPLSHYFQHWIFTAAEGKRARVPRVRKYTRDQKIRIFWPDL